MYEWVFLNHIKCSSLNLQQSDLINNTKLLIIIIKTMWVGQI